MPRYRIMAFDGGGVRGILTARLLARLTERYPGFARTPAMLAGTSTGAILAAGLASGRTPAEMVRFYEENSEYIFSPQGTSRLRPKYGNAHLLETLRRAFPSNPRLSDLDRAVVVCSFMLTSPKGRGWHPVFFNNLPGSATANTRVIDAIMCSTAAPGYFPSWKKHIDGGITESNPAISALSHAMRGGRDINSVKLLSIGTGYRPQELTVDTSDWGELQWVLYPEPRIPLVSAMYTSQIQASSMYCSTLLGRGFYRLNTPLPKPVGLDAYGEIPLLLATADATPLEEVERWIAREWYY